MKQPLRREQRKGLKTLMAGIIAAIMAMTIILFAGCCKGSYPPPASVTVHDTITMTRTVTERDTVLTVPGAGVSMDIAPGDTAGRQVRNRQAGLKVTTTGKGLHIDCRCDTVTITAKLRDSLIMLNHQRTEQSREVVREQYTPWPVKGLAWVGGMAILLLAAVVIKTIWWK